MIIEQAVILCGGKGTRLNNLTKKIPKPLLKINNEFYLDLFHYKMEEKEFDLIIFLLLVKNFFYISNI